MSLVAPHFRKYGFLFFLGIALFASTPSFAGVPATASATQDDSIADANSDGRADPGEQIDYTTIIRNTGTVAVTGLRFVNPIPADVAYVTNSIKSTPLARDDSYASVGNVGIDIAAPGVLNNDFDLGPTTPTVVSGSGATAQGGSVTINSNGSFSYTPPAGFTGTDTFTYTIKDEGPAALPAPATGSNIATVSIAVTGMIWFVDGSAGAGGDGTLGSPFDTLTDHNGNSLDQNGDCIFVASGSYSGGIVLQNNQKLIGQGAGVSLQSACGITPPTGSKALPSTGLTRPEITTGSGNGISLASGNTIRGLNIGNTAGDGIGGTSVGALSISEVAISGTGGGVDLASGTLSVTFDSISSSGSDNGIRLANTGGTFTVSGDGATSGFTQPVSGDNITLLSRNGSGGAISSSSHGISLTNASGVTLRQINIANTGGDGINLSSCSGVTLSAVDIGNTTGSCYEAVELTGNHTIDNRSRFHDFNVTQTHAIDVRNTNANLTLLQISDTLFENQTNANGAACIDFDSVTNSTMAINIDDCEFVNLFGSAFVIAVGQSGGTVAGETTANVRNNLIRDSFSNSGFMSAEFGGSGESDLIYNYTGNLIDNAAKGSAVSWHSSGLAQDAARLHGTKSNNTIRNILGRGAIAFRSVQDQNPSVANHVIDGTIHANTIDNIGRESVYVRSFNLTSDMDVKVSDNMIGQTTPVGFDSFNGGNFVTIDSNHRDDGDLDIHIDNNTIAANSALPGGALNFLGVVSVWTDTPASDNVINARITNNTINNSGSSALRIHMDQFTGTTDMDAHVDGNSVSGGTIQLWEEIEGLFELFSLSDVSSRNGGATMSYPGSAGTPTNTNTLPELPTFNFPNP